MILRLISIFIFLLFAAGLQLFTVAYGHWAEIEIISATSIASLVFAFAAGGLAAFEDRARSKKNVA
ncbi:TPA: hypothetical protein ACP32N_005092 [Pseudomonas aeruginosa]